MSEHYRTTNGGPDVLEFAMQHQLDFCTANILKYAFRLGHKKGADPGDDLTKIFDYAERAMLSAGLYRTADGSAVKRFDLVNGMCWGLFGVRRKLCRAALEGDYFRVLQLVSDEKRRLQEDDEEE